MKMHIFLPIFDRMTAWISLMDIDQSVFYLINTEWTNAVFDTVLPFVRNKMVWIPLYVFIISYFLYNFGRKGYHVLVFLTLSVVLADLMSSKLIKPLVHRLRPCNDPFMIDERLLVHCGQGYSFPSSHAANHFAIAIFLILVLGQRYKWITSILLIWASVISYAQVYVGVHFPMDILCGAVLGVLIGYVVVWAYRKSQPYLHTSELTIS